MAIYKANTNIFVGHSALIKTVDGLRSRLMHASSPIELVFPNRCEEETPPLDRIDEIAKCISETCTQVLSIHAPALEMDCDEFIDQALRLARLAEMTHAASVTLHPSKCFNAEVRPGRQTAALRNLKLAQAQTDIILALETLGHGKCLHTCPEIMESGAPMVLDTTHIGWEASYNVLSRYADKIVTIHLSERTEESQHLPVEKKSLDFVEHLCGIGWRGNIILEYWPWRSGYYTGDIEKVKERICLTKEGSACGENTYSRERI